MNNYYTSDWHLGDPRIGNNGKPNVFYRDFPSIWRQNNIMVQSLQYDFQDGDTLWHLGDVVYDIEAPDEGGQSAEYYMDRLRNKYPKSKFNLILGNYDVGKEDWLQKYFDQLYTDTSVTINGREYYMNHYPVNCLDKEFSLTGHIHGLWKVQHNMINVGVDAWHNKVVSDNTIDFCRTACEKYYDKNAFPYKP